MQKLVYGHRGAPSELPENTLPSFARALQTGANALEMDAHLTRDGRVVILHDDTGERMAGEARAVRDSTFDEVKRWDVGWGWKAADGSRPYAGKGYCVATMEEVVESFPGVWLNVDAKSAEVAGPLVRAVLRAEALDRVRIASFSQRVLHAARDAGWTGALGLGTAAVVALRFAPERVLRSRRLSALRWCPIDADAAQVPVRHGPVRFDTPGFVERAHRFGLRVDFWTIDDRDEARRLFALGADGVVTNCPALVSGA
jgi:glycerophosphoryl diester phosphodiesterase